MTRKDDSPTETETAQPSLSSEASATRTPAKDVDTKNPARYELLVEKGRGGLGVVFEAYDTELDRVVAVKELRAHSRTAERRFVREARITAKLEHPAIVPVHEVGRWPNGTPYYSMKLVAGRSLREILSDNPPLGQRLELLPNILAVCEAIAYAHSEGVIHRDLKPANIVVGDFGATVVIDWGLAKDVATKDDLARSEETHDDAPCLGDITAAGAVVGTPAYMPPEQARGEDLDQRADVYALGAVLYRVLCGRTPYGGASSDEVIRRLLTDAPTPIEQIEPQVPRELLAIAETAMARDPSERYRHAGELAAELRRFLTGDRIAAYDYSRWQLVTKWVRRHRIIAISSVLAIVASSLAVYQILDERNRAREGEAEAVRQRDRAERANDAQRQTEIELLDGRGAEYLRRHRPGQAAAYLAAALRVAPATSRIEQRLMFALDGATTCQVVADARAANLPPQDMRITADGTRFALSFPNFYIFRTDGRLLFRGGGVGTIDRLGNFAAFQRRDGTARPLRIIDLETGEDAHVLSLPDETLLIFLAFSPDGRWLAASDASHMLHLWSTEDWSYRELTGHTGVINHIELSDDGSLLATTSLDGTARIWDPNTGRELSRLHVPNVLPLNSAFVRDRTGDLLVATVTELGPLPLWNPQTGDPIRDLAHSLGEDESEVAATFAGDGQVLVTATSEGLVVEWSAQTGARLHTIQLPGGTSIRRIARHGRDRVAALTTSGLVFSCALGMNESYRLLETEAQPTAFAFTGDGTTAIVGDDAGTMSSRDLERATTNWHVRAHDQAVAALATSTNGRVVATTSGTGGVILWNGRNGTKTTTLTTNRAKIVALDVSRDGALAFAADINGTAWVWEAASGRRVAQPISLVLAGAFSPDGARLAIARTKGRLDVLDADTLDVVTSAELSTSSIESVAWAPDGRKLGCVSWDDYNAFVVDTESGKVITNLRIERDRTLHIRFNPTGETIATTGATSASLWTDQDEWLASFDGAQAFPAAFSRSGAWLATSTPHEVVLYRMPRPLPAPEGLQQRLEQTWLRVVEGRLETTPTPPARLPSAP